MPVIVFVILAVLSGIFLFTPLSYHEELRGIAFALLILTILSFLLMVIYVVAAYNLEYDRMVVSAKRDNLEIAVHRYTEDEDFTNFEEYTHILKLANDMNQHIKFANKYKDNPWIRDFFITRVYEGLPLIQLR